jgi:DNA modification methylase
VWEYGVCAHCGKDPHQDNDRYDNVWEYITGASGTSNDPEAYDHPAIFPDRLAEDHIRSWSNENDIVLDPFAGSGTTPKMARKNKRQYIGIEISQKYIDIANKRFEQQFINTF